MTAKIGLEAIAYLGSTDIGDVANVWTELDIVEEVSINMERAAAEVKNRGSDWVKVLLGQNNATLDLTLTYDPASAGYEQLRDAYLAKTDVAVAAYDGDIATSGNQGLQMDAAVVNMQKNEPLEETNTVTFSLRPSAKSTNDPEFGETT